MVVCDGFVGNIVLKFYESVARVFVGLVMERAPDVFERPEMRELVRVLDYSDLRRRAAARREGVSIICHGASSPNAIKNGDPGGAAGGRGRASASTSAAEFAQREPAARA